MEYQDMNIVSRREEKERDIYLYKYLFIHGKLFPCGMSGDIAALIDLSTLGRIILASGSPFPSLSFTNSLSETSI
jgi:hypothetical protein